MMGDIKVLIAEDVMITAKDLSNTLRNLGCETCCIVKTGEEAVEKALKTTPDLIFMDIMLKGFLTGIEAAEQIKKEKDIPLVFLTALNDDETFLKAYNISPLAILSKPFQEKTLIKILKSIVHIKKVNSL
jgi:CheY-like chemotaxis protein